MTAVGAVVPSVVKPFSKQVVRLYEVRKTQQREDEERGAQCSGPEPLLLLVVRKLVKSALKISNHEMSCYFDVMARSYCGGLANTLNVQQMRDNIQGCESELASKLQMCSVMIGCHMTALFSALRTKATSRPLYDVA
jgi:hypothetical protein